MQAVLKNCPGLGLLIVSSVSTKSAGCDSRPLCYLLTTGLGILSTHLPHHRLRHISILRLTLISKSLQQE
ncbi:hypothetical protein CesoFtcFv8_003852 [Champsocephalus esox]|nr:hypothetical protein CesoFtcFv8_003852 [Champsocephalus esox]KAK5932557.1 hypothetical protein CgunFtcFv8_004250 [Champsocephalus gunnari]